MCSADPDPGAAADCRERSRAKIPLLFGLDVIHGFRTTFPIPLAEAATWNPEAVEISARVAAAEASSAGIHWTFGPMVDIARDPRWGRIAEGSARIRISDLCSRPRGCAVFKDATWPTDEYHGLR